MTDQCLGAFEILLRKRRFVAFHADLQRINQAARVTADRASLQLETSRVIHLIDVVSCPQNTVTQTQHSFVAHRLCVHFGDIEELISTFSGHWQSDGQIQEADREVSC